MRDREPKPDITSEESLSIMEVIAATGKFWHDWDMLKSLLSFRLKQVLAEYPEAQVHGTDGPQPSSLSEETYPEVVRRLDEALLSFIEGPPFTLQRLCEILLSPKSTYKSLSKLALALEKNLLVTSTLSRCTDPYPKPASATTEPDQIVNEPESHPALVPNGIETVKAGDTDEEMVEAEADESASNANNESNAQTTDTEVHDEAQLVHGNACNVASSVNADAPNVDSLAHDDAQNVGALVRNDAQHVDTLVHDDAQNAGVVVHDNEQTAGAEVHDSQPVDTEMQDGTASDAMESNPVPSSDSDATLEQTELCMVKEENNSMTQ